MSQPQTKTDLARMAWVSALRQRGARTCDENEACALAVLTSIVGHPPGVTITEVGMSMGLTEDQTWQIITMNDGRDYGPHFTCISRRYRTKRTFAYMADVIEGWFKP